VSPLGNSKALKFRKILNSFFLFSPLILGQFINSIFFFPEISILYFQNFFHLFFKKSIDKYFKLCGLFRHTPAKKAL